MTTGTAITAVRIPGITPPRQARSRETFERVLDIGAQLFAEQGYDQFSITELCRRAEVSPGALYSRISGKDALVLAIHDRELTRISAEFAIYADEDRWSGLTTADLIYAAVRELGAHYGRHAPLLRAFILRAAVDDAMREHGSVFATALSRLFTALLLTRASDIVHPDPAVAVDVTHRIAHASLSYRIAFGESFESDRSIDWDHYVNEIAASACAYLLTLPTKTSPTGVIQ